MIIHVVMERRDRQGSLLPNPGSYIEISLLFQETLLPLLFGLELYIHFVLKFCQNFLPFNVYAHSSIKSFPKSSLGNFGVSFTEGEGSILIIQAVYALT